MHRALLGVLGIFRLGASALFVLVQSVASREANILIVFELGEMNHNIWDMVLSLKDGAMPTIMT